MILILILISIALFTFVGLFIVGAATFTETLNVRTRVSQRGDQIDGDEFDWRRYTNYFESLFKPLGKLLRRSPENLSHQSQRLIRAGIRRKDGPVLFHGVQVALIGIFLIVIPMTGYLRQNWLLCLVLSAFLGILLPDLWLTLRIKNRKQHIELSLPDALDLMVVCVEAGLGMDRAMMRISQELQSAHPEIGDELKVFALETNAGKNRADALRDLGSRTDVADVKEWVSILIQSDRFGTSVAQALRTVSDNLRTKRRQRAEERAAKIPVKMIPPLVLFIFPAIFVVVIGPAVIQIVKALLPALSVD
jgi:tight adherence protein C